MKSQSERLGATQLH